MYDILGMPYRIEQLGQDLLDVYENDSPPDYGDYFWARQHGWAVLGLEFSDLGRRLREHAALPAPPERQALEAATISYASKGTRSNVRERAGKNDVQIPSCRIDRKAYG